MDDTDRRLDRRIQFDERSREYPIRELIQEAAKPRSYTWRVGVWLDQGREGACVGFAWAHELAARPSVRVVHSSTALVIYREAQKVDEWPGESYSGTSVLAGAKVVAAQGLIPEYRWAFGLEDLILAVGYKGPAVIGVNWYEGMFAPDAKGFLHVEGRKMGGHAILCHGVSISGRYFKVHNSWGRGWGHNGEARISFDDMERLLREQGEACIPVKRVRTPKVVG